MEGLSRSIQKNFYNILIILLAGGFVMLLIELLLLQHTQGLQLVAIGSVVLGLILTLVGLGMRGGGSMTVGVLLLVIALIGIFGVFAHYQARQQEIATFQRFAQGRGAFPQGNAQGAQAGAQANDQTASQQGGQQVTPPPTQEGAQPAATDQSGAGQGGAGQGGAGQGGGGQGGNGGFQRGQGGGGRPGFGGRGGAPGALSFREPTPPPLAPLGLTGLSLLAAVVVLGGAQREAASEVETSAATA